MHWEKEKKRVSGFERVLREEGCVRLSGRERESVFFERKKESV